MNSDFEPYLEEPPLAIFGRKPIWEIVINKIRLLSSNWYVVGVMKNKRSAASKASFLRKKYPDFKFQACKAKDSEEYKIYALKISEGHDV